MGRRGYGSAGRACIPAADPADREWALGIQRRVEERIAAEYEEALFDASGRSKSYQIQAIDDPINGTWKDHDPYRCISSDLTPLGQGTAHSLSGCITGLSPEPTTPALAEPNLLASAAYGDAAGDEAGGFANLPKAVM